MSMSSTPCDSGGMGRLIGSSVPRMSLFLACRRERKSCHSGAGVVWCGVVRYYYGMVVVIFGSLAFQVAVMQPLDSHFAQVVLGVIILFLFLSRKARAGRCSKRDY